MTDNKELPFSENDGIVQGNQDEEQQPEESRTENPFQRFSNYLGVSFSKKRGQVRIFRATIKALKKPEYIRFLFNRKELAFAIQVCEPVDQDFIKVPELFECSAEMFRVNTLGFINVIYEKMGWNPEGTYRIRGVLVERYRLVLFYLEDAEEISDAEFEDPDDEAL